MRFLLAFCVLALLPAAVLGQPTASPLAPPDRSTPHAALKTFLDDGDRLATFLAESYLPSPTYAEFLRVGKLGHAVAEALDLSQLPLAARGKAGNAAALALYETLSRITLPPLDEQRVDGARDSLVATNATSWAVPGTEIILLRQSDPVRGSRYVFSPETVSRAAEFHRRIYESPYVRTMPMEDLYDTVVHGAGWPIPPRFDQSLPDWLRATPGGQPLWKWLGLVAAFAVFVALLRLMRRIARSGSDAHPLRQALARLLQPAYWLVAMPILTGFALIQLNMRGGAGVAVQLTNTAVIYLAGAWMAWRLAAVLAEAILASPSVTRQSIDAHLTRICTRLLGIGAGAVLLGIGADRLGVHAYGIIAGLGVGGLALALAAQPTIENLIGGMSLFADKPIRVGDRCVCEGVEGIVEAIGIRSTSIRAHDQSVTSFPNATLSKMSITNLSRRDRMLIHTILGVRYETSAEQLRCLLSAIRELLAGHSSIHEEGMRVRLVGFGESALNIEIVAFARASERAEFLTVQEDILLQLMQLVEQAGTGFAFPSRTVYLARDGGPRVARTPLVADPAPRTQSTPGGPTA